MIRVRFAPSPTGYLHIGAARTALLNWLYARKNEGEFILRIEDTDKVRSSEKMTDEILKGLEWLGLDWEKGPIFQSQRFPIYIQRAEELVKKGFAYYCYCSSEEISQRKKASPDGGISWVYDRRCLNLSEEEKRAFKDMGKGRAVRFFVPDVEIRYRDMIHGDITVKSRMLEDFVLVRRDGLPTYHLSVVVDDIEQGITHIIRGDDHLSNTPKQILLYRAFQAGLPKFAHIALILGPDKKKLSKRHGVKSVLQFRDEGYLPLAFLNFMAQMSWSPGEGQVLFSPEELIQRFNLKKLSKGSPVYDEKKLNWLNSRVISEMSTEALFPLVRRVLEGAGLWNSGLDGEKKAWTIKVIDLLKQRSRSIKDFSIRMRPFLIDDFEFESEGMDKHLSDERLRDLLPKISADFKEMGRFTAESIENVVRERAEKEGIKAALFIHSIRMLVLGMSVSPGIFEVLELIGKQRTVQRIEQFLK
jgi:glutamyl-tRNA synthetase/nondiscriminating glutamyl-tRNA synthetase